MNTLSKLALIFAAAFLLSGSFLFAQSKDTSDYFAVGVLFGNFDTQSRSDGSEIVNSFGTELEYYKFRDLSFFAQGLYVFKGSSEHIRPEPLAFENPGFHPMESAHSFGITFGGKYFLRTQNFNPFLELGLNQQFSFGGGKRRPPPVYPTDNMFAPDNHSDNSYNLSLGIGAGLSIKVDPKFKVEMKYDLYRSLLSEHGGSGYSILIGGKFNL